MVTFLKVLLAVPPTGLYVSLRRTVSFRFRRNTRLPALVGLMASLTRPALVATFRDVLTRSVRAAADAWLPACLAVTTPGPGTDQRDERRAVPQLHPACDREVVGRRRCRHRDAHAGDAGLEVAVHGAVGEGVGSGEIVEAAVLEAAVGGRARACRGWDLTRAPPRAGRRPSRWRARLARRLGAATPASRRRSRRPRGAAGSRDSPVR